MAIFDDERSPRATPALAAIAALLLTALTALFALPAVATPAAPPAHVAVGGDPTDEDPGGECCVRGNTWDETQQ